MPRREYRSTFRCAEPGCREAQWLAHDTRADQNAAYKRQYEHPFKCSRHADPDKNLRPGNEQTCRVLVASKVRDRGDLYWVEEGTERGANGFTFGPGFNAYASDFPEGTRLVVTAQIEMPVGGEDPEMFGEAWMAEAESGSANTGAWVESADEAYATAQAEGLAAADLDDGLNEDGFCISGCPDDVCRNSGHCAWPASGPEQSGPGLIPFDLPPGSLEAAERHWAGRDLDVADIRRILGLCEEPDQ